MGACGIPPDVPMRPRADTVATLVNCATVEKYPVTCPGADIIGLGAVRIALLSAEIVIVPTDPTTYNGNAVKALSYLVTVNVPTPDVAITGDKADVLTTVNEAPLTDPKALVVLTDERGAVLVLAIPPTSVTAPTDGAVVGGLI